MYYKLWIFLAFNILSFSFALQADEGQDSSMLPYTSAPGTENFTLKKELGCSKCNRFSCKKPGAFAYCVKMCENKKRTFKKDLRGLLHSNPNCVKAYCKWFGEQTKEQYKEVSVVTPEYPRYNLALKMYDVFCLSATELRQHAKADVLKEVLKMIKLDIQKPAVKKDEQTWSQKLNSYAQTNMPSNHYPIQHQPAQNLYGETPYTQQTNNFLGSLFR